MMKKLIVFFMSLVLLLSLVGCSKASENNEDYSDELNSATLIPKGIKKAEKAIIKANKSDYNKFFISKNGKKYVKLDNLYTFGNGEVTYEFVLLNKKNDMVAYDFQKDEFLKIREIHYLKETDKYVTVKTAINPASWTEDRSIILERANGYVPLEKILFSNDRYCLENVPESQGETISVNGEKYLEVQAIDF